MGSKYTSFENVRKGFNLRDLGKDGTKRVDKIAKGMIKSGLIMSHPTSYGLEISLNPKFSKEILGMVKKFFSDIE